MKTIFLLRHAKSSWDDPNLDDFHRPLTRRGRRSAELMAGYLRRHRLAPAVVLCSPALRTRQTLERLEPSLGNPPTTFDPRIYDASWQALLFRLREVPPSAGSVLLIGHNPGLERLALSLTGDAGIGGAPAQIRLRDKYPTGALAILSVQVDVWEQLDTATCRLENFIRPIDMGANED